MMWHIMRAMAIARNHGTKPEALNQEYTATLGPQGRLVIPAELRRKLQLEAGSVLTLWEDNGKISVRSRAAARATARQLFRDANQGASLVDELIAERRTAAAEER